MITIPSSKKRKAVRGPKYPPGIGVRKILLIALDYPDGIREPELLEKIQEKLPLRSRRGIKAHLDDLGPGRTVRKKWKRGKAIPDLDTIQIRVNRDKGEIVKDSRSTGDRDREYRTSGRKFLEAGS